MENKPTLLFSILVLSMLSFGSVYGMTVDELLKSNPSASDIQKAVDDGDIRYSDLPGSFQINIHDKGMITSTPTKPSNDNWTTGSVLNHKSNNYTLSLVFVLIFVISIYFVNQNHGKKLIQNGFICIIISSIILALVWASNALTDNDKIGLTIPIIAIFYGFAFGFIIRGKKYYSEKHYIDDIKLNVTQDDTLPKGFTRSRIIKHDLIHSILLQLGIIKVKNDG